MTLEPLVLPSEPSEWLAWGESYTGDLIARYGEALDALREGGALSTGEVLALWNDADILIGDVQNASTLLSEVHPDAVVRGLFEDRAREAEARETARWQDAVLYGVLAALDTTALEGEALRLVEKTLKRFRLAGVDLPPAERAEIARIDDRIAELSQDFSRNVRDAVRSIRVRPEQLAGLPQDFVDAHPVDAEGLVTLTTDYPDVIPVRTFARDRAVREALTHESDNRAWPENDPLLAEILELRARKAELLGFVNWPDYDGQLKMAASGEVVERFIEQLRDAALPQAQADAAQLLARLQSEDPSIEVLDSSNAPYASELLRRERYAVDSQEARPYFDIAKVRQGLLDVTGRLFGLSYTAVPDAPVWHPEVYAYDVAQLGEGDPTPLGRIYLDLHPREGKFKHAAAFGLRIGIGGRQLASGALACNFNRGQLDHDEVVTLFHEFGHLVHGVVASTHEWAAFSGITTEWDFVEAPSQMLEEWAWDPEVLRSFASDASGEPIPVELVERMRRANGFGRPGWATRQLAFTATSHYLHRDRPADRQQLANELQSRYDVLAVRPGSHYVSSFGHLTGYGSAYYTYLWSLVIAKDLFTAFDRADLFAPEVARRYRDLVLAQGGAKDAAQLVEDFLGRPYGFDAFAAWLAGD